MEDLNFWVVITSLVIAFIAASFTRRELIHFYGTKFLPNLFSFFIFIFILTISQQAFERADIFYDVLDFIEEK